MNILILKHKDMEKSKDKIVERLLDNKSITTEEAIVLLKESSVGFKQFPVANDYFSNSTSDTHKNYPTCMCGGKSKL